MNEQTKKQTRHTEIEIKERGGIGVRGVNADIAKNIKLAGKLAGSIVEAHELNIEKAIDSIQIKQ